MKAMRLAPQHAARRTLGPWHHSQLDSKMVTTAVCICLHSLGSWLTTDGRWIDSVEVKQFGFYGAGFPAGLALVYCIFNTNESGIATHPAGPYTCTKAHAWAVSTAACLLPRGWIPRMEKMSRGLAWTRGQKRPVCGQHNSQLNGKCRTVITNDCKVKKYCWTRKIPPQIGRIQKAENARHPASSSNQPDENWLG